MKKIAIFGYSGFASEIADICDALSVDEILYLSEKQLPFDAINGIAIVSEENVFELAKDGYKFAIGISDSRIRKKISQRYAQLEFANLIHPSATFGRKQQEKLSNRKGVIVAAGARFMSGIEIGDFVVVGLNTTIGHDCKIGSYVSIMPGVNVSGNVFLDDEVFVGSGAVILQGDMDEKLYIHKSLTVGAGAVVTKSIRTGTVVVGVPAKIIK